MKRDAGIFTFLTIFLSSLVSAGPVEGVEQLASGAREVLIIVIQFLSDVMFDLDTFDEFLFAKILLMLVIFFVVYTVLKRNDMLGKDRRITIIITSAISILAVRYLPDNFVQVILLQYSTFGVAITTLIPLAIFFFFLHQSEFGSFGRRGGWLFYGIVLIALTSYRYTELDQARYIYWAGIAVVIISFIFDKMIHDEFNMADVRTTRKRHYIKRHFSNQKTIREYQEELDRGASGNIKRKAEKEIERLEKENNELAKHL